MVLQELAGRDQQQAGQRQLLEHVVLMAPAGGKQTAHSAV